MAVAILAWILLRPSPSSDSYWALIWGRNVLSGDLPQVDLAGGPSAHPLGVGVGVVAGLFGREGAVELLNALVLLSLGATLVGIFRLAQLTFGTAVAWAATAATACNFTLANLVMSSSLDVSAYALTTWAAVLVARRPLSGVVPLVLVGLAGLQRPEVWLLSAAYWLYLAASLRDRRRVILLMVLAGAPVACWIAFDLVVTRQLGSSLNQIQAVADNARSVHEAPLLDELEVAVPPTFRLPFIALAVFGIGLAVQTRVRAAILPAVIGFLGLAAAGVYVVAGIIIVSRFIVISALMCALFVGYAVMGGVGQPGRLGRAWRIGGVLAGLVVLIVGARQVDGLREVRASSGDQARASAEEFQRLVDQPRVSAALENCTPVWMQTQDSAVMYLGSVDPEKYRLALTVPNTGLEGKLPDRGALVEGLPALGLPQAPDTYRLVVPAGFSRVGSSGRWTVYERGC